MRIETPGTALTAVGVGLPKVEPWMKQQVEASFQRVKNAILTGNFSAFLAEQHPDVFKHKKIEDLAIQFGELKQTGIKDWDLDTLHRDQDGIGAKIKNAPENTIAYFLFNGADQLKFMYLGKLSFS